jgi:hypothetical protein
MKWIGEIKKYIDETEIRVLESIGYILISCILSIVLIILVYFFG